MSTQPESENSGPILGTEGSASIKVELPQLARELGITTIASLDELKSPETTTIGIWDTATQRWLVFVREPGYKYFTLSPYSGPCSISIVSPDSVFIDDKYKAAYNSKDLGDLIGSGLVVRIPNLKDSADETVRYAALALRANTGDIIVSANALTRGQRVIANRSYGQVAGVVMDGISGRILMGKFRTVYQLQGNEFVLVVNSSEISDSI